MLALVVRYNPCGQVFSMSLVATCDDPVRLYVYIYRLQSIKNFVMVRDVLF